MRFRVLIYGTLFPHADFSHLVFFMLKTPIRLALRVLEYNSLCTMNMKNANDGKRNLFTLALCVPISDLASIIFGRVLFFFFL